MIIKNDHHHKSHNRRNSDGHNDRHRTIMPNDHTSDDHNDQHQSNRHNHHNGDRNNHHHINSHIDDNSDRPY